MPTSASPPARKGFNYASLDAETTHLVQQNTSEIRALMKRTAQGIVEIGHKLIEVKERLGHGRFGDWLESEFDWSWDTAVRFMNVASRFSDFSQIAKIAPSALYELASPSTPQAAREEALTRAEAGEPISYTAAKAIKQKYAPPPKKTRPPESKQVFLSLEPVPEVEPQVIPAPPPPSNSKLEIIAIRPHGQIPLEEVEKAVLPQSGQALSSSNLTPATATQNVPAIWWLLGGQHLLCCANPNSAEFLGRVATEKVSLLLAFPLTTGWLPTPETWTRLIVVEYLPSGKDSRLFEDALEANLLLCSEVGDTVVCCFLPSLEILSIVNRLGRRGIFAEPDSRRCNTVVSDWKRAGLKAERLS